MANRKRRSDSNYSEEEIRGKIRRLEQQLSRKIDRRRVIFTSSSDEDDQEQVCTRSTRATPAETPSSERVAAPGPSGVSALSAPGPSGASALSAPGPSGASALSAPGPSGASALPAAGPSGVKSRTAAGTSGVPRQPVTPSAEAALDVPRTSEVTDPELNDDVLLLLGDAPEPDVDFGKPIHKDIASRWQEILTKGLPKEVMEKLLKEYLIPKNCDLLVSPILNPEAKVALSDFMVKRDAALSAKQKQIGIALAALSQVVELVINKESSTQKILKPLGDACRILCDSHFCETKTRRGFVLAAINADLKDTITQSKRDNFLFGSNISEQLKSAKTIKESGSVLKQAKNEKSYKFNINNFIKHKNNNSSNQFSSRLNWKTTPRRAPNKQEYHRPSTRRPATRGSFQQREKTERSPARRSRRR